MIRDTFIRWWHQQRPRWLSRRYGERLVGTMALWADSIAEAARQASRRRYPDQDTPEGELTLAGEARGFIRYPGEDASAYLRRIRDHWDGHRTSATGQGIRNLFLAAGYDAELVRTSFANYQIIVWGRGRTSVVPQWGAVDWAEFVWGYTATSQDITVLRGISEKFLPARMRFGGLRAPDTADALPGGTLYRWQPVDSLGTGDWEDDSSGDDIALANIGGAPTFVAADSRLNGAPTFELSDAIRYTSAVAMPGSQSGVMYIIGVFRRVPGGAAAAVMDTSITSTDSDSATDGRLRIVTDNGGNPFPGTSGSKDARLRAFVNGTFLYSDVKAVLPPENPHCIAIASHPITGDVDFWVNGVKVGSEPYGGSDAPTRFVHLYVNGVASATVTRFGGNMIVGELGIWYGTPTDAIMQRLARYARDQFGCVYSGPDPVVHPYA